MYLADELLVDGGIAVGAAEGLLEEGEEDGYDNGGLDGLTEDDEEDGDGEDVGCHGWLCLDGGAEERGRKGIGCCVAGEEAGEGPFMRRSDA